MTTTMEFLKTKSAGKMILIAYPVALILMIISIFLLYVDIITTVEGYKLLPTAKPDVLFLPWVVGVLPTMMVVFSAYNLASNEEKQGLWLFLLLAAFLPDFGTDIIYKMSVPMTTWYFQLGVSMVETFTIFTVGSELVFSLTFPFVVTMGGDFAEQVGVATGVTIGGVNRAGVAIQSLTNGSDDYHHRRKNV